jgi:hypothetical protein
MSQLFHRSSNTVSRASIILVVILVSGAFWAAAELQRSPYYSWRGVVREQPVPFSHQHHVAGLGLDCRYCHVSVETSNFAGVPPTKTCINCHQQIWTNAALLEPVRESYRTGKSIEWTRVNAVPDYVYFDHSIHINKGVGCKSCHGPVDQMPLMRAENTLQMEFCLNCHREPEKELRPKDSVFDMTYQQPVYGRPVTVNGQQFTDQLALGTYLKKLYHLRSVRDITSCNTCHR